MEQYVHLLIAKPDHFVPTPTSIVAFCQSLVDERVVPDVDLISVSVPTNKVKTITNPFTQELITFPIFAHQRLTNLTEFDAASQDLANYCLHLGGTGTPDSPPLEIQCDEPYSLTVRCHVTSTPHGTSAPYDEDPSTGPLAGYDRPCADPAPIGHFTHPTTKNTIEVPEAGRARFWIEFELGKWLFPIADDDHVNILNPMVVKRAEHHFGVSFAQGCHYF